MGAMTSQKKNPFLVSLGSFSVEGVSRVSTLGTYLSGGGVIAHHYRIISGFVGLGLQMVLLWG